MPGVFLAAPSYQPAPDAGVDETPITHTWQAWDGTIWDLSSGRSGIYLRPGLIGMGMPPILRYKLKSAARAGSIPRGVQVDERPVTWPLKLFRDGSSQDWIDHNRAWYKTLHPEKTGQWIVTQPNGEYRTLQLALADDNNYAWGADDPDPELFGFANYTFSLVAEAKPYWQGEPKTITWEPRTVRPFLASPDDPYVLYISSSNAVYGARIENPGPVAAYPVWRVHGPFTSASVGVGSDVVTLPFGRTAGHYVTIDTVEQTAVDDLGVNVVPLLGSVDFAPVPPGNPSQLNVTMAGTGSIDVTITPNYYTAVGN